MPAATPLSHSSRMLQEYLEQDVIPREASTARFLRGLAVISGRALAGTEKALAKQLAVSAAAWGPRGISGPSYLIS